jgi:serine/threonine protein kinase/ABC-type transport system substrate-binding protein
LKAVPLQSGQTILHYRVLEKIGQGGMGEVYKAEDQKLGRQVALKLLPPDAAADDKAKRRLLQEARAASALNHPNIVTIYSIEEAEGFVFIVMEYVEGKTLKSIINQGAMEPADLIQLGAQVADALAAAHAAGLIHRDIKPSNILVTPSGQAKILDFGLAKLTQVSDQPLSSEQTMSRLTKTGMVLGTLSYMSPEQTRGETLDARTDIFSLGCVLYEAATGKMPFSGPSILSVLHEIATADPQSPSAISNKVPQGLESIIKRCLTKDREKRYSSAAELANALRGLTFANRYQILRELGRGGMGVVHLAHDPLLERDVAIKVISPDLLSADAVERFKREARVVAKMDHPAIVHIHDLGEHEGSLFFIMPFVQGTSLRSYLNEQSLSLGEVIDIGIQVAQALEYSHSLGVIHRDIKPENVMVARQDSGVRVRVTDFGLAMASSENRLTRTGSVVGTMCYLSPEQLSTKIVDGRSDIYSLGVVLYECLTGKPPFSGEVQSVLYRIAHESPDPPRMLGAEIQEELENIIMQCLEKDPAKRPQSAGEFSERLMKYRSKLRDSERIQKLSTVQRASSYIQRPAPSPFIGREKEFTELQRRMSAAALQGECQFAAVSGEAGVGKTRLLEELENIAKAKKFRVLHSRFVELDQAFPYQGFCEIIQEYFHLKMSTSSSGPVDFSDLAPDLISLFPVLAEMDEISRGHKPAVSESQRIQDRTYIYDVLARAFLRIGAGKPLVIFFEDIHNADVSLEALQYIVRRMATTPTFIVGTFRSGDLDKHHPLSRMLDSFLGDRRFVSIRLESFDSEEHEALLQSLIGSAELDQSFVKRIFEATDGNPHFTKELVRSLIDSGKIVQSDTGAWNLSGEATLTSEALPPTIQQAVEKRIERLPEEWREILSVASVIGKTFEFQDLELLAEGKDVEDKIDEILGTGFIEEVRESRGDVLAFSSSVVRDVLYAKIPRRKRRSLHRKYAEHLENRHAGRLERIYPLLVHHYAEGDIPEKVIEFGLKHARKSLEAMSAEDVKRAANMVLDFIEEDDQSPVEGEAHSLLAMAHRLAGDTDSALQEFDAAIRIFEKRKEPSLVLDNIILAAETAWEARKTDESRDLVDKGLELARETQHKDRLVHLLSLAATVANLRAEYDRVQQYLDEAERIKPSTKEKEEAVPQGGALQVALPSQMGSFLPVQTSIIEENEVGGNAFETLLDMDDQGHIVSRLCESWEVLERGKSFLFTLRPNIRMHDGEPLTAEQVQIAIQKAIRRSGGKLPAGLAAIRGVQEFLAGESDLLEGITVESQNRFRISLDEALPLFPSLMTDSRTAIMLEKEGKNGSAEFIGTGPFRMTSCSPQYVKLERNEHYWKGTIPPLDSIEFNCGIGSADIATGLKAGKFDMASNLQPKDLEEILQDPLFRAGVVEVPKKNVYYVLFRDKSDLAKNDALRKALCGVVRIDDLVRGTLGRFAQPATGLIPPGILGHDPGKRRQPLLREEAVAQLESSGLKTPVQLRAAVHPIFQDRYQSLTKELFKNWADLGVEVTNVVSNMASYLATYQETGGSEGIDLLMGRWNADYDDPDNFTYYLFHSKAGVYKFYSNEEIDKLMEEARAESDPVTRTRLYRKIESMLMESGYVLPLFYDIDYRIASPKVRRLVLRSRPPYVNYSEVGKAETVAQAPARRSAGGIISVPLGTKLMTLDPSLTGTLQQAEVLPNIFETLTRQSEGARIIPFLASSVDPEEGGKRFRIAFMMAAG